ncbi:glycerophosphodiester phosphodiesterase [Tepidiforma sp.]|uniref:glycerophosphodiester phosphodiesterase n=1 Tax=Tepidiforma sp. TaxID=2682230 RepID=UPI002ADE8D66|nr:glycerophosphodiester phosphodiesterase family protein [Tepidiforma sp.]
MEATGPGDDEPLAARLAPLVTGRRRVVCAHSATLSGNHAPNTLAGVVECVRAGVPRLEVDLRFLADDSLLCFHDVTLERLTDRAGKASDLTGPEARQLRCRSTGEPLAFLEEVVEAVAGSRTLVQVDLKLNRVITETQAARLEEALAPVASQVIVGSQSPWNLRRLRGVPVAFDPTQYLNYTAAEPQAPYPRTRGVHGFWDDSPAAANPNIDVRDYLLLRIEELRSLVPGAIEWMVDIGTILRMLEVGVPLGRVLRESGIELAAWTLHDGPDLGGLLARLWEADATTVITDAPLAVAGRLAGPAPAAA